jgi:hypothetical protein
LNEHKNQTLEAKIRRFAGELTPEEQEQLRAIQAQPRDVTGLMSSSLWDKAQQVAGMLTTEEEAALRHMLARAGVTTAGSDEAEAQGFRMAAYEDEWGYKGKPGTGGASGWQSGVGGGGNLVGGIKGILGDLGGAGIILLAATVFVSAGGASVAIDEA